MVKLKSGNYPCPICQPEMRRDQKALSVRYEGERVLLHCHKAGCDFHELAERFGLLEGQIPRGGSTPRSKGDALRYAIEIWEASRAITGTRAEEYLRNRGVASEALASIRYHHGLRHAPTQSTYPALIGRFSNGAIHRIYLTREGVARKADIEPNKMALGQTRGAHISIRRGVGTLLIAEGIEDALSLAQLTQGENSAVWACLSATQAESVALPPRAGRLLVGLDNDGAGNQSAYKLAKRAQRLGWYAERITPKTGKDWNECLLSKYEDAA